jgi:predicted Zn-dependent protease
MRYESKAKYISTLTAAFFLTSLASITYAPAADQSKRSHTDVCQAYIKGNNLVYAPDETMDRLQSNDYVTVVKKHDCGLQVLYHDPNCGNRLVKRDVLPGSRMVIAYWNEHGIMMHQEIIAGTLAPPMDNSQPAKQQEIPTAKSGTNSQSPLQQEIPMVKPVVSSQPAVQQQIDTARTDSASKPGEKGPERPHASLAAITDATDNSDNYCTALQGPSGLRHWELSHMPLKVYIAPGTAVPGYEDSFLRAVKQAFDDWTQASNDRITFKYQSTPASADIVVNWTANPSDLLPAGQAAKTQILLQEAGQARVRNSQGIVEHSDIFVLTKSNGPAFEKSYNSVHSVALHEIGHSLGLIGHSPDPGDIMYATVGTQAYPSHRDIATLNVLYKNYTQATAQASPVTGVSLSESQ